MSQEALHLTPEPEPAGRTGLRHDLQHYADLYGTPLATIKRWRKIGLSANPKSPPPLDDPVAMPDWYAAHHTWKVPDRLLAAASAAQAARAPVPAAHSAQVPESPAAPAPPAPASSESALLLTDMALAEDEEVLQAERILKATITRMEEIFARGDNVAQAMRNYTAAQDVLTGARRAAIARRKAAGEFVPIAAVKSDLSRLAQDLRDLDDCTPRLVCELLPDVPPEFRARIAAAFAKVTDQRQALIRRGVGVPTGDELALALVAA